MSDLISRKLAIELLENTIAMTKKEERRRNYCVELIKDMPSAEPVRHGKWIDIDEQTYTWKVRCSCCGNERSMMSTQGLYPNFCENCGARMDEDERD